MIPPQLIILAAKYGTKILAVLILVAGYYYWKHEVVSEARNKAVSECNESREKFRIDAEHFKLARLEEVEKANNQQTERVRNAIKTYIEHYESLRNTPVVTSLRVKANCPISAGSNTLPGADQSRSKVTAGIAGFGEAELPARNLQELNRVISDIERMELKCEQLLNTVP